MKTLLSLLMLLSVQVLCAAESSDAIPNYIMCTPDTFLECRYLTIINTQDFTAATIFLPHSSQVEIGKGNNLFMVDHLDNRTDRLLCFAFDGSSDVIKCFALTDKLRVKLSDWKDFCRFKITKLNPLTLAVTMSLRSTTFTDENSTITIDKLLDGEIPKRIYLKTLLNYKNLWNDKDPYKIRILPP